MVHAASSQACQAPTSRVLTVKNAPPTPPKVESLRPTSEKATLAAKAQWALTDPLIPVVRRSLRRAFIVAAVWCAATAVGLVLFLSTPDRVAGLAIDAVTGRLPPPDPTSEVVSDVMFWVCRVASLAYLGVESIGVIGDRRRHRAEPVQGLKTKYPST